MSEAMVDIKQKFELGKLYYERGDFEIAIQHLLEASDGFFANEEVSDYLDCQNCLLRMYVERADQDKINEIKDRLQDLVLNENFSLTAKTYYTLAVCASSKKQHETSLEYCQKSLQIALKEDGKEDICNAILGIAICYKNMGRHQDALKEIYNLNVFFEVIDLPEVQTSKMILNGNLLRRLGRFDEALEVFWSAYDVLKKRKNLWLYLRLLYCMGVTYQESGDNDLARMYLQLASRSIDSDNFIWLSASIDRALQTLGVPSKNEYDLVFDRANNSVVERKKGKIEFKNQFILLDLLHLFLQHPGSVFSKEQLVQKIWKQEYNPSVHDNKIYVTIKRLRKLIEPDFDKPKYVFRAKNGYYLNKSTRVLLEQ